MDRGGAAMPDPRNSPGRSQTRAVPPRTPMQDIQDRLGIPSVESLLAERQDIVTEMADLWARWGPGGTGDDLRKAELSRLKGLIRAQAARDGRKRLTNGQIDDEAHEHPDYLTWLTTATRDRATYYRLENRRSGIEHVINRGQMIGRYLSAETYLTPRTG